MLPAFWKPLVAIIQTDIPLSNEPSFHSDCEKQRAEMRDSVVFSRRQFGHESLSIR